MKKILLFLLLIFTISGFAQSWVAQESGTTQNLNDVFCLSANTVIVVGNSGTILKTTDGGENWIPKSSGSTSHLQKIQFADAVIGYALGDDGTLLKTNDAGENWTSLNTDVTAISDISCIDQNTFYMAANGWLKKTVNGGNSFEVINNTQIITKIQFLNGQKGFASTNENLLKTIDGGITWTIIKDDYIDSFFFLSETTGFVYSSNGNYKTIDAGQNFSEIGFSMSKSIDLFALNENAVWEINGLFALCGCPPEYCIGKNSISTNENLEITNCNLSNNPDFMLNAIHFASETIGFSVGAMGHLNPMNPNGPKGAIYKNTTGEMEVQSVDEKKKEIVKLFPNPASDQINIAFAENPNQEFQVSIMDYLGKTIFTKNNLAKLDLSNVAAGVYFAKIETNNGISVQKFIRK